MQFVRPFFLCQLAVLLTITFVSTSQAKEPLLTAEKLFELGRLGDAAVSPDGRQIAYMVTYYNLPENSSTVSVYVQPLNTENALDSDKAGGSDTRRSTGFGTKLSTAPATVLLKDVKGLNSVSWIKRPEGYRILYVAPDQQPEPKPQAWIMDPANPAQAKQLTSVSQGISNLKPSPAGDAIAFTVNVKMDTTVNELYADLPKADASIIDSLMYRHWNQWHDFTYSHLHTAQFTSDGTLRAPVDLMADLRAHCPLPPHGGSEQFTFSPDGSEIAATLKLVDRPAESTDSGIYLIPSVGGSRQLITANMPGYDMEPKYSPDGRKIAFQSMQRPGFEADRNRIMVYDRSNGSLTEWTRGLDQTTHETAWDYSQEAVYFASETRGTRQIYRLAENSSQPEQLTQGWFDFSLVGPIADSHLLLVKQQSILRPTELAVVDSRNGSLVTITDINGPHFEGLAMPQIEERHFMATDGKKIHSWIVLPPDFDPSQKKKWPMLTYCQGGPQGQIGQWFSYRWNFHLMAANGYIVLAPNRRGLPGFGTQWNDQISGDWGGQAMQDILSATDGMLTESHVDPKRVAAVGASFGGYTVYWLMGNSGSRFCAMISHCGVFNLESMYGSTEELFFVNWDLGGPYWQSPSVQAAYDRFSPHRFARNWQVPLLVVHGEKDFRVPVTQGIEAFTAAQVQGVPSRFLYFPEEGHWVTKPQNSVLWNRVFFQWLDTYCKPETVN